MNYRHIFHAGNICDVVKHSLLVLCLDYLRLKDKEFFALDTHAGIGLYDLSDERASKTKEAETGIMRLLAASPLPQLASYYKTIQELNPGWSFEPSKGAKTTEGNFKLYPGSPFFIQALMRSQDRLVLSELHPEDVASLRRTFYHNRQVHVHHRDGYEALNAFLPPPEKRGLVLIDPPFEKTNEFDQLALSLQEAYRRWPQGMFLAWYPIKERPSIWRFHEALIASGISKQLCTEFIYAEETRHDRLNGSGCIIINPPWQLDEKLPGLFKALHDILKTPYQGMTVKWLKP